MNSGPKPSSALIRAIERLLGSQLICIDEKSSPVSATFGLSSKIDFTSGEFLLAAASSTPSEVRRPQYC